jgi:hypothetical protein
MEGNANRQGVDRGPVPQRRCSWEPMKLTYVGAVDEVMQKVLGSPDQGGQRRD